MKPPTLNMERLAQSAFDAKDMWYAANPDKQFDGRKFIICDLFNGNVDDTCVIDAIPSLTNTPYGGGHIIDTPQLYDAVSNVLDIVSGGNADIQADFDRHWKRLELDIDEPQADIRDRKIVDVFAKPFAPAPEPEKSSLPFPFKIHLN